MNRLRIIPWAVAGGAAVALVLGFALGRKKERPAPPAVSQHENLPDVFHRALTEARDRVARSANDPAAVRKLARLYHANRLYPEARASYQLLTAAPGGLTAHDHYYLADIAQNENDLAGAQKELGAALQAEPGYGPARLALAETLFKSGREEEAAGEYSTILAGEADNLQAALGLARIELQRGDDDAAVARLEELVASHPEATSGAALLAQVMERKGETDRAIALTQWSRQKPEPIPADPWMAELLPDIYNAQHLGLKFEEYFKTGQMEEATRFMQRMEELDGRGPLADLLKGWSASRAHRDEDAARHFRAALEKGGDPEKICPYLVQALLGLGREGEAASLMAGYCARRPDSIPLATAYAEAAVKQGDTVLARRLLAQLLRKQPYLQAQNMSLAKILWTAGERDEAAQCLQRVAAVYAKDVASRALLGEYFLDKHESRAAVAPLEQALRNTPAKVPQRENIVLLLGRAYAETGEREAGAGRWPEAAALYEKATQLAPADLDAYANHANILVHLERFGAAAEVLEKMARLQPENPTIQLSLGDVLYQKGDKDQAVRRWQKALQSAAPADADLKAAITQRLTGPITAETFQ